MSKVRITVVLLLVAVFAAVCLVRGIMQTRRRNEVAAEQKHYPVIERDVCEALAAKLGSLSEDDPIVERYGRLERVLKTSGVSHPSYAFQLVERLGLAVSVEFKRGNANMGFGITYGPSTAITRLDMRPSAEWMEKNPEVYDGVVLKNINQLENNVCLKRRDGGLVVSMFDGWATHPLAVGEEIVPLPSDSDELPSSVPSP